MSCGCNQNNNCNSSQPVNACDPEAIESQITNFITMFVGTLTKTSENGVCVWELPCDLDQEIPAYPRNPDEGVLCYLYRIIAEGAAVGESNVGFNVGSGVGIYKNKTGVTLNFKSLTEGLNISLTGSTNEINIAFEWADVPTSSTDTGSPGQVAYDGAYFYTCYDVDLWSRCAMSQVW